MLWCLEEKPVKCIDTPLLIELLLGKPSAKRWIREMGSSEGEFGTTEFNMTELALEAQGMKGRPDRRLDVLDTLRLELTVLPVDRQAYQTFSTLAKRNAGERSALPGMLTVATALAHGSTHLWTDKRRALPRILTPLKVVRY